jgi:hypothetical protein
MDMGYLMTLQKQWKLIVTISNFNELGIEDVNKLILTFKSDKYNFTHGGQVPLVWPHYAIENLNFTIVDSPVGDSSFLDLKDLEQIKKNIIEQNPDLEWVWL